MLHVPFDGGISTTPSVAMRTDPRGFLAPLRQKLSFGAIVAPPVCFPGLPPFSYSRWSCMEWGYRSAPRWC